MTARREQSAGSFSTWLRRTRAAHLDDSGVDVPCGTCTACCTSSYFIHIRPDEAETLARIPGELLFAAPDQPKGYMVLGYDERGRCPMLRDGACSIYEHRPLTCRTYDCRVFAAARIAADRAPITQRARRWKFTYPTEDDRDQHTAVRAAARFLQGHGECFPAGAVPDNPAHVAVLAVKVYDVFLRRDGEPKHAGPASSGPGADRETAEAAKEAYEKYEAGRP